MPIFQPSMTKSSSLSRARGGGDAGSQTPRCSAAPIRCMHRRFMDKHDRRIPSSAPQPPPGSDRLRVDFFAQLTVFHG